MLEEHVKTELKILGLGYIVLSIVFMIAFQKSNILEVLRVTASVYWMFVLPGYVLTLCSRQPFMERLIIGIVLQVAVFANASYYFGLLGWHVSTHGLLLPLGSIAVGILVWRYRAREHSHNH